MTMAVILSCNRGVVARALSAGSAWGLHSPSKRGPLGPTPDGPGAKRIRTGEPEAQVTRWHVKEEDFEFYGVGRCMPCSVPVHLWEGVMAAQGGALIKADHQKADDAAVPTELWDRFLRFTLKEKLRWDFPRVRRPRGPWICSAAGACDGGEEGCSRISGGGDGRTTHCARTRAVSHG